MCSASNRKAASGIDITTSRALVIDAFDLPATTKDEHEELFYVVESIRFQP
jgi:hypothetical protein